MTPIPSLESLSPPGDDHVGGDVGTRPAGPTHGPRRPERRRARVAIAVVAGVVAVALGLAVFATRDGGGETAPVDRSAINTAEQTTATTATSVTAPAPTTAATAPAAPASGAPVPTTAAPGTTANDGRLADGDHAAYLTGLDTAGRTVEVNVVQFLTGEDADEAWRRAHPDDPGGVANDYFVLDENPRLRTMPVAPGAEVVVVMTPTSANAPHAIAFEDLPAYVAGNPMPDSGRLWPNPFWLTVEDGTVVALREQYTP